MPRIPYCAFRTIHRLRNTQYEIRNTDITEAELQERKQNAYGEPPHLCVHIIQPGAALYVVLHDVGQFVVAIRVDAAVHFLLKDL